ncbi:MAG: hypothetical protein IT439_08780 [Phycisphaerales bacterium]|nr:hypothetical protein [Phycisphaerales bacterium]
MLTRLAGRLAGIEGNALTVEVGAGLAAEVLVPAYLAERLAPDVGAGVALYTVMYLESQGQGTSFLVRLLGFASASDRAFFNLFTTVKGIGNKRALRAMAAEPGTIARAVRDRDTRTLQQLPEIGKRMAETIIAELSGKVDAWVGEDREPSRRTEVKGGLSGAALEAIAALVALGESETDAEKLVRRALTRPGMGDSADALVAGALGARG